ncbi:unnamed protein product [Cunninghamella blakesleeana]
MSGPSQLASVNVIPNTTISNSSINVSNINNSNNNNSHINMYNFIHNTNNNRYNTDRQNNNYYNAISQNNSNGHNIVNHHDNNNYDNIIHHTNNPVNTAHHNFKFDPMDSISVRSKNVDHNISGSYYQFLYNEELEGQSNGINAHQKIINDQTNLIIVIFLPVNIPFIHSVDEQGRFKTVIKAKGISDTSEKYQISHSLISKLLSYVPYEKSQLYLVVNRILILEKGFLKKKKEPFLSGDFLFLAKSIYQRRLTKTFFDV